MIILIGAGGLAKDYLHYSRPHRYINERIKIYDDNKTGKFYPLGIEISGTINDLIKNPYKPDICCTCKIDAIYNCIGSTGNNSVRNSIYSKLKYSGIYCYSLILTNDIILDVNIGNNVLINLNAQIHHDCIIEDNCVIGPGAIICGNVHLCDNCYIGAGAIVKQGLTIGKDAVIGMGAVVLKDVPDGETWVGNPARRIKA